jgi:hypothetical protein
MFCNALGGFVRPKSTAIIICPLDGSAATKANVVVIHVCGDNENTVHPWIASTIYPNKATKVVILLLYFWINYFVEPTEPMLVVDHSPPQKPR